MNNAWWKPPKIVICYRRQDAVDSTGRLYKDLTLRFNSPLRNYLRRKIVVVRDFDNIPGGRNYEEFIASEIQTSAVILAVIGNDWLRVVNPRTGKRRIDEPNDSLRKELTTALSLSKPIIPVLVEKAQMPAEEDLPDALKPLAKMSAREISDPEWDAGVERLVKDLEAILGWRLLSVGRIALALAGLVLLSVTVRSVINRFPVIFGGETVNTNTATPPPSQSVAQQQKPGTSHSNQQISNVQQPPPPPSPVAPASPIPTTPAPTPTPNPTPVEDLTGTQWEYRTGNVVYIWDFMAGGRLRSRHPNKTTYLPDGKWVQKGDTLIVETTVGDPNSETYRGKIMADRMEGTFVGQNPYTWTATRVRPSN